jgi:hypothetical protein
MNPPALRGTVEAGKGGTSKEKLNSLVITMKRNRKKRDWTKGRSWCHDIPVEGCDYDPYCIWTNDDDGCVPCPQEECSDGDWPDNGTGRDIRD